LSEPGYARSEEAESKGQELWVLWKVLLEKYDKWRKAVDNVKIELQKVEAELKNLSKVKETSENFEMDMEEGLVGAETGMQAAVEQATSFWQDLFKISVSRVEYKDDNIRPREPRHLIFNILPSHVYIRNITDVDIFTSDYSSARTVLGTLSHIRIQAMHLSLNDISF
jgi:hypothetical protein